MLLLEINRVDMPRYGRRIKNFDAIDTEETFADHPNKK